MTSRRGFLKLLGIGAASAMVASRAEWFLETVGPSPIIKAPPEIKAYVLQNHIIVSHRTYNDLLNVMHDSMVYGKGLAKGLAQVSWDDELELFGMKVIKSPYM